jgi:hypothetical protein
MGELKEAEIFPLTTAEQEPGYAGTLEVEQSDQVYANNSQSVRAIGATTIGGPLLRIPNSALKELNKRKNKS